MANIAAVQDSLERDWEINFESGARPSLLPSALDDAFNSVIRRLVDPQRRTLFLAEKPNRDEVWRERIRALFRGRITQIEIYYPGRLRADLGSALARFGSLRRLKIFDADFSVSDWSFALAGVQRLHSLEELAIGGHELRDAAIEPLARQPSLRKVTITAGKLGTASTETFATLPRLRELEFEANTIDDGHAPNELPLPENQKLMRDALPRVEVRFR